MMICLGEGDDIIPALRTAEKEKLVGLPTIATIA
jgi:hypothetical protein